MFDSMCVDGDGNICIATIGSGPLGQGGITVVKPDGELHSFIETGDPLTTNIAFGGPDHQTAFITVSLTGQLLKMRWHCKGHLCHFEGGGGPLRSADVGGAAAGLPRL